METNLRQPINEITVEGTLSEKNLELVNEKGIDIIKGTITVQTSEDNFATFSIYNSSKTKA